MDHDYIIIGAGTAGCLLANRLSADPGVSVLLLEAGGPDDYFWIDIPVGYLYTIDNPRTDWRYRIEPDPGLNGRSIGYARGKVIGGCSSINAMVYMRGQASDYDHWASLGNRGCRRGGFARFGWGCFRCRRDWSGHRAGVGRGCSSAASQAGEQQRQKGEAHSASRLGHAGVQPLRAGHAPAPQGPGSDPDWPGVPG